MLRLEPHLRPTAPELLAHEWMQPEPGSRSRPDLGARDRAELAPDRAELAGDRAELAGDRAELARDLAEQPGSLALAAARGRRPVALPPLASPPPEVLVTPERTRRDSVTLTLTLTLTSALTPTLTLTLTLTQALALTRQGGRSAHGH